MRWSKFFLPPLLLVCCARTPLRHTEQAMRLADTDDIPTLNDDLPVKPLAAAIKRQISHLRANPNVDRFRFGERTIPKAAYLAALGHFLSLLQGPPGELRSALARDFDFYEVYGDARWGEVFITSYYEALIRGSRRRRGRFTQALYKLPPDLVDIHLGQWENLPAGTPSLVRGRLIKSAPPKILPYHSRAEIDGPKAPLSGLGLEWCWVSPEDAFWMQIQGSGTVLFADNSRLRLGYAGQNGHPYRPIGKFLTDVIPLPEMNLPRIEAHLADLSPKQRQELFAKNPSYVFFKKNREAALTFLGVPATAGRTIATDARFFPKGALALLAFERPIFDGSGAQPAGGRPVARFVLDQDVGGAIKGGGRVDLFWGRGKEAKRHAGVLKKTGKLFYLVPKKSLLAAILDKTSPSRRQSTP